MVLVAFAEGVVRGPGPDRPRWRSGLGLFGHAARDHGVEPLGMPARAALTWGMGSSRCAVTSVLALSARYGGAPVKHS